MEQTHKYKVTVKGINGNATALSTNHLEQATRCVTEMFMTTTPNSGTIATIYEWDNNQYKFYSEMKF